MSNKLTVRNRLRQAHLNRNAVQYPYRGALKRSRSGLTFDALRDVEKVHCMVDGQAARIVEKLKQPPPAPGPPDKIRHRSEPTLWMLDIAWMNSLFFKPLLRLIAFGAAIEKADSPTTKILNRHQPKGGDMKTKAAILSLSAVLLVGFATVSEAKRFGGGKSSGSHPVPARKPDYKDDELPENRDADAPTVNIRLPASRSSGASTSSTTTSAGTAALAADTSSAAEVALSPEEVTRINEQRALEERFAQKAAEEQKAREAAEEARKKEEQGRIIALAAAARAQREKREQQEAERRAKIEHEQEIELQRQARMNQCVIKPVMTDAEIAICKEVWR